MYKMRRRPKMIGSFKIMLLKEKIDALNKHKRFICSRIFEDMPDVKKIIELEFLGGSRRQQLAFLFLGPILCS
jgi:hypothetical protein